MTMTRDEAEKAVNELLASQFVGSTQAFLAWKERIITDLTTDTEMYEGEPKEEWRKTEEKIEACMKDLEKLASTNMLPFDTGCTRSILTKHFGGGKP